MTEIRIQVYAMWQAYKCLIDNELYSRAGNGWGALVINLELYEGSLVT